jgi:hypothetical protein
MAPDTLIEMRMNALNATTNNTWWLWRKNAKAEVLMKCIE